MLDNAVVFRTNSTAFALIAISAAVANDSKSAENVAAPRRQNAVANDAAWLARSVRYLASDELEGRGLETEGIHRAAEFLRDEFAAAGLQLWPVETRGFQRFELTVSAKLGADNLLRLTSPADEQKLLTAEKDFIPLSLGGGGDFDLPLAFVGYGISAPDLGYDDYAGVDVNGHAVVILRHEPQRDNPHSAFDGTDNTRHAPLSVKTSNAFQHGAAAVIFVTDAVEIQRQRAAAEQRLATARDQLANAQSRNETNAKKRERLSRLLTRAEEVAAGDHDELMAFNRTGNSGVHHDIPVIHCKRRVINQLLGTADLEGLEFAINEKPAPHSMVLSGCRIAGRIDVVRETTAAANVVGLLPGSGAVTGEAIVVGAHYDHLGRGEPGSAEPDSRDIHNGADDNASGAVALVEVARLLKGQGPRLGRQVIFVAFTGEERGLFGSAHFVKRPPVALEDIVAMINFDMVGRLRDNKLILQGTGTASQFDGWLDEANRRHGFELVRKPGGYGPSDHTTFYAKRIPVLHLFTGSHREYHKPGDDFELLNLAGIGRISQFTADLVSRIANGNSVDYVLVDEPATVPELRAPRPYFGSIPDFGSQGKGYAISGVAPGSPADEGGLGAGDAIVQLGPHRIGRLEDFDLALRKFAAGEAVTVAVMRGEVRLEFEVILAAPR